MPNHITNQVSFIGKKEDVTQLLLKIHGKSADNIIDFNKIIPMPEELHHVTSPARIISKKEYEKEMIEYNRKIENPSDTDRFIGITHSITKEMSEDYIKRFGADNWYDWACEKWGTKWNAYSQSNNGMLDTNSGCVEAKISFQTAWSYPGPIIEELSTMFPDIHIEIKWADEDFGCNVGKGIFYGGSGIDIYIPTNGTKEAYELAFEVLPEYKKDFKLIDGEYVYIDN